jgi:23S rRNA pseudouridine1911/1915/1917 synthase
VTRLRARHVSAARPDGVEEGSILSVFRVPRESEGMRLDVFMVSQFRRTSRTRAQGIIKQSAYGQDGKRLRPNDRVFAEQLVCLWRAPWDEVSVPTEVPVLYEDEWLMVVDKPSGLPVHPTARYFKNTLIKVMEQERPGQFITLVHRIDRETSGTLIIAKDPETDRRMKKQLEERADVEKGYRAITWGVPGEGDFANRTGLARNDDDPRAFRFEQSVELDPTNSTGVKMRLGISDQALHAATRFRILDVRARGDRRYAEVQCDLETGRQHQIRIHLEALGAPIVGDKLYGPDERLFARGADGELTEEDHARLELPRHALHAARLAFNHPRTGVRLVVEAPMPEEMAEFWEDLERV